DDLGAAVVAVLAELDDQQARPAPLLLGEGAHLGLDAREAGVAGIGRAVDAGDAARSRAVASEHLLKGIGDLADRGAPARRLDGERQQITPAAGGRLGEGIERRAPATLVARLADLPQARDLLLAHAGVVDVEQLRRLGVRGRLILVDAD